MKKIKVFALGLVAVLGAALGAYQLYDYNEHKPLILKCTVNESIKPNPYKPSDGYIWKFTAYRFGWSVGPDDGFWGAPNFWDAKAEDWDSYNVRGSTFSAILKADKNRFTWNINPGRELKIEINRNSGDFSVIGFHDGTWDECGEFPYPICEGPNLFVEERGNCKKSGEPERSLKQRF